MKQRFEVKIWGTRGSLAAPYADRMEFGGNSSCASVKWNEGIVVFDCGTGLHAFGQELLADPETKKEVHIFLSHLHLDHICALPFFPLLFRKDWTIHLYGQPAEGETLRETIGRVIKPPFWPVTMNQMAANIIWHDLRPDMRIKLPGEVLVKTFRANHGQGALLYRIERGDASFVYGLDHEMTEETNEAYCRFIEDADLLLFDGMYTEEEYQYCKGFGHSVWNLAPELAEKCRIGTVCISHHDWKRTDTMLLQMEKQVREKNKACIFAREGMIFHLGQEA